MHLSSEINLHISTDILIIEPEDSLLLIAFSTSTSLSSVSLSVLLSLSSLRPSCCFYFLCPLCFVFCKGTNTDWIFNGSRMSRLSVSVFLNWQHTVWVCVLYMQGWDFKCERKWETRSDSGLKWLGEVGTLSSGQVFPRVCVTISLTT